MFDIFSTSFLYALGAIILIDLVLAGDNALVIAMAARKLPDHLRKRAILWGTFGAIAVRSVMTFAVVWLLQIPGLLAIGGIALVWIAVRLLAPKDDGEHNMAADVGFWGAMKTIVIADAVMGVDNVLAVAGAAHGNYILVGLGLLISIPIVVWGSNLVLKLIDRFPSIIYLGAVVLAWTAAKMIVSEPMLKATLAEHAALPWLVYAVVIGAVLGLGYWINSRKVAKSVVVNAADVVVVNDASMVEAVATVTAIPAMSAAPSFAYTNATTRILVPVDASPSAHAAVEHVLLRTPRDSAGRIAAQIHLVHVLPRLTRNATRFLSQSARSRFYATREAEALTPFKLRFEAAGALVVVHAPRSSDAATEIATLAKVIDAQKIVVATRRGDALARWMTGSLAGRVIDRATVPVEVVISGKMPVWRRMAVPMGLGMMMAALAWD